MQYKLLKYLFCIWATVHQIKTLTFNKSRFLSTRISTLAFFLAIICYCSVRNNNTKNYWQSEVSYTEGKCYARALQSWFLWINHASSMRKCCYTDLGADSHHLLVCPYCFSWELLTNKEVPACSYRIFNQMLNSGSFIIDSKFLQEFL